MFMIGVTRTNRAPDHRRVTAYHSSSVTRSGAGHVRDQVHPGRDRIAEIMALRCAYRVRHPSRFIGSRGPRLRDGPCLPHNAEVEAMASFPTDRPDKSANEGSSSASPSWTRPATPLLRR